MTRPLSPTVSGSVWTRIALSPEVVTTGAEAASTPVPATATRRSSAVSWVTWLCGSETRYCAPPVNSMPKFRPLNISPEIATRTITAEMAYQSQRRPTKSNDLRPE